MIIEQKLKELYGLCLPDEPRAGGVYSLAQRVGNVIYISGQTNNFNGELMNPGVVGRDLTLEQGQQAARYCMLNLLAIVKKELGGFDKLKKFVQLIGFVQSDENFHEQHIVMNGASQMLADLFPEKPLPTRMALGASTLPSNASVEILAVVEVE